MEPFKLKILLASTRPSRKGPAVADWFMQIVKLHPQFDAELLDLKEINLPMMDENEHPRFGKYNHQHTLNWSRTISSSDAFVFVTPEYNHSFPAALKNALDYLFTEWQEKPVAFVSYGGISAGTRAVQELTIPVTTLGMMPLPQAVNIPFFATQINEEGLFLPNDSQNRAANAMLKNLLRWAEALKGMRNNIP